MHGVELCQRHHRTLGRRIAGCRHVSLSLTALLKPLASAHKTCRRTCGNCIGNEQLLLPKSLSWQLVLVQLHSGQVLQQHAHREPPSRREWWNWYCVSRSSQNGDRRAAHAGPAISAPLRVLNGLH